MMHDFAMTAEHIVFMDLPIVFNLDVAIKSDGDMPHRWDDGYGARLGVMRRDDPFGDVRWFDIGPCYVFHVANAYDSADAIVLQVVRYPELWRDSGGFDAEGVLWTWTIDLRERHRHRTPASTIGRSNSRESMIVWPDCRRATRCGRRYRLVRYDLDSGDAVEHSFGSPDAPGGPGEAVFVPSPSGPPDETNGWYLASRLRPGARQQRPGHPGRRRHRRETRGAHSATAASAVRLSRQLDRRPIRQPDTTPEMTVGGGVTRVAPLRYMCGGDFKRVS